MDAVVVVVTLVNSPATVNSDYSDTEAGLASWRSMVGD